MSCVLGNMNEQHSCVNEAIRTRDMNEQHSCVNEAIRTRGRAVFGFGIDIRFRA